MQLSKTPGSQFTVYKTEHVMAMLCNSKALLKNLDSILLSAEYRSFGDDEYDDEKLNNTPDRVTSSIDPGPSTQPSFIFRGIQPHEILRLLEGFPDTFMTTLENVNANDQLEMQKENCQVKIDDSIVPFSANDIKQITIRTINLEENFGIGRTKDVALALEINDNTNLCFTLNRVALNKTRISQENRAFQLSDYLKDHNTDNVITLNNVRLSPNDCSVTLQLQDGPGLVFLPMPECITKQ